jgi:anaerobic magnesium-protoporphyrin IX monomethyl ester cyclase
VQRQKIILYNPKSVFFDMPLALLAIGSPLDPEKYEVIIVDGRIDDNPSKTIESHLNEALCFGVTSLTGSPIKDAIQISRFVKKVRPELPVIWGGWHTSLFPEDTLRDESSIDITVQGQGEKTFQELVEVIEKNGDLASVDGICYRDESGKIVKNKPRTITAMDEFSDVNYELIDVEKYFEKKGRRQLDYISSTGCHFRCTFCADPFVYERKWTAISAEKMVNKLAELHEKYKFTDLNLQDETYFTFRNRVVEIAQLFIDKKLNISWAATMRADQGSRLSEEDFELCSKSGLRRLLIGVESGSQEMMDWLKKDIKMEQVYTCADRCKKHNIAVIFPFIVGFPGETEKSVESTKRMALELNRMHPKFETPIFYFKPYPGSAITDEVVAQGYKLPQTIHEWAEFDYIGSSGPWMNDEKYQFFEKFKFYMKLGFSAQNKLVYPLQWIAKKRLSKMSFGIPVEFWLYQRFGKKQRLS